ncbi:MAG: PH domain-containing protein [Nitrososphaeraceae archaeon]
MRSTYKLKLFGLRKRLDTSRDLAIRTSEKFSIQPLSSDDMGEIRRIQNLLNPDENVIIVARQSRILPGGSYVTPNTIYATEKRLIIRDPYMLGIKENLIDIPYDVVTSIKLDKGLFTSTIRFEAPALVGSKKLGMVHGIIHGNNDHEGVIQAIPKAKAEDLIEVIRFGMHQKGAKGLLNSEKENFSALALKSNQPSSYSIADELTKLMKLKEQGVLNTEEFDHIKKGLLDKKAN